MEFRYKVKLPKSITVGLATIIGFLSVEILYYSLGFHSLRESLGSTVALVLVLIISYPSIKFYKKKRIDKLLLGENGITQYTDEKVIHIEWESIDKINWINSYRGLSVVLIKGLNKEIIITSDLEDFPLFVNFLKSKFGNRFNTKEIPIEYKISNMKQW